MNQGKFKVVKQVTAKVNNDILGINEWKWNRMGDDHYIYYCGQESHRRNGVAVTINKRVWNAVLGCNLKNDRMISVRFQGKTIQYHSNPSLCPNHCQRSWSWTVLWRPTRSSRTNTKKKKRCPFHHRGLECKYRSLTLEYKIKQGKV